MILLNWKLKLPPATWPPQSPESIGMAKLKELSGPILDYQEEAALLPSNGSKDGFGACKYFRP